MKKLILALLVLACASSHAASLVGGGGIGTGTVLKISGGAYDGKMVIPMVGVDSSGCLTCGATVNCTNCGGSGSGTVSVVVTNSNAAPVPVTQNNGLPGANYTNAWTTSDNYIAAYLTTTAGGTAPRNSSYTAVALTGGYSVNVTTAAGVSFPCRVCLGAIGAAGGNAGVYYGWGSTFNTPYYYAITTTPVCFVAQPGTLFNLSVTAAALSVTVGVHYDAIY